MTSLSFKALTRWAEHVKSIWEAIKRAAPESQVYLTGGAAEGRLTALSDIDIVIALKHEPSYEEAVNLRVRIMEELDRAGVPSHIPLDIHIVGVEDLKRYKTLIPLDKLAGGEANSS